MRVSFIILFAVFSFSAHAQKRILLTKIKTGEEIFLTTGTEVTYVLKTNYKYKYGTLTSISDSTFQINGVPYTAYMILGLGEHKRAKKTWGYVLAIVSGVLVGSMVLPSENSSQTKTIGGIAGGLTFIAAEWLIISSGPKTIGKKWKLGIVN